MIRGLVGTILVLVSAALFAAIAVAGKVAFAQGAKPEMLVSVRFIVATVVFWTYLLARGRSTSLERNKAIKLLVVGGLLYGTMSIFYFAALVRIPASMAVMLLYAFPAIIAALSPFILGERISAQKIGALVVCSLGIALILGQPAEKLDAWGVLFGLGSAVSYALYLMWGSKLLNGIGIEVGIAYMMLGTAVVVTGYGAARGGLQSALTLEALGILLAIGLATVVALITLFAGIRRVGAMRGAIISTFEPLVTVGLSLMLLAEVITLRQAFGGLLIVLAVVALQLRVQAGEEAVPTGDVTQ